MSSDFSERFHATYRLRANARDVQARAQALALEQSIEMPLEAVTQAAVRDRVVARVESIEPVASPASADGFEVKLSLATRTTGLEAGQLLNMLFGNCSLQPDVELVEFEPSAELLQAMPGPRFGVDGWRRAVGLDRGQPRALTCTALKPQGLPPQGLAELARTFALAGIDVIKDDHGIADQADAPFAQRVAAVQRAIVQAAGERGSSTRSLYAPTLSGGPRRLREQLRIAREEGVGAVLVCPMLCGVPTLVELVREEAGVPILAHPAFAGNARVAPALLLGRMFRMFGADATIFPNFGGRFSYDRATCRAIAQRAREPLGNFAPSLPVPAGGMRTERVGEMIEEFGTDVMLLIGGHLLAGAATAGDSVLARATAFVRQVHAAPPPSRAAGRAV
ncbi:MAG TPA: RuBisCO large subunit C-terminal-like domain-containing protein [Burkholderiaceae bacterium]|jgi:ribulose-bisphosphate carboxylase large chain|nr:RuBisCO large subunit C-terminal-like domain-containing protein [Burkholderiaceae bacterium]